MTFRELVFEDELATVPGFRTEPEKTLWEVILENNGPIMKTWFVVMLANIVGLLLLF
jgi:hypothetical protein